VPSAWAPARRFKPYARSRRGTSEQAEEEWTHWIHFSSGPGDHMQFALLTRPPPGLQRRLLGYRCWRQPDAPGAARESAAAGPRARAARTPESRCDRSRSLDADTGLPHSRVCGLRRAWRCSNAQSRWAASVGPIHCRRQSRSATRVPTRPMRPTGRRSSCNTSIALNAAGKLPVLVDGDKDRTETVAILHDPRKGATSCLWLVIMNAMRSLAHCKHYSDSGTG
jgi:hypothetical protein